MIKIYIFISMFALNLVAADIGGEMKDLYDSLSKTMPQPISDFVSTFSLGLFGLPLLLLISSPMIIVLYAMYKTAKKFIENKINL